MKPKNRHSQHFRRLKTETDGLSTGLNMAIADVLETRITRHARKGQKAQNYLNHDCYPQNENEIPIKDDTVAKT